MKKISLISVFFLSTTIYPFASSHHDDYLYDTGQVGGGFGVIFLIIIIILLILLYQFYEKNKEEIMEFFVIIGKIIAIFIFIPMISTLILAFTKDYLPDEIQHFLREILYFYRTLIENIGKMLNL